MNENNVNRGHATIAGVMFLLFWLFSNIVSAIIVAYILVYVVLKSIVEASFFEMIGAKVTEVLNLSNEGT